MKATCCILLLSAALYSPAFADPCSHSYLAGVHHLTVYNYLGQPSGTPLPIVVQVDNQTATLSGDTPSECSFVTNAGVHDVRVQVVPNQSDTKVLRTETATVTLDRGAHWDASCELSNNPGLSCDYLALQAQ